MMQYIIQYNMCPPATCFKSHLAIVAAQVANVLAGVSVVDLDGVVIHRGEVRPAMAEAALSASLDPELFERTDVVHQ